MLWGLIAPTTLRQGAELEVHGWTGQVQVCVLAYTNGITGLAITDPLKRVSSSGIHGANMQRTCSVHSTALSAQGKHR